MKVSSIQSYRPVNQNKAKQQSFGNAYVTLAKANLADTIAKNVDAYNNGDFAKMFAKSQEIAQRVIDNVNKLFAGQDVPIKNVNDLVNKIDLFVLAAGKGSRFTAMADAVATLQGKSTGSYNKISVPFEIGKGQEPLTMLEIPMAMGRFFAKETGYDKIVADKPTGSFGDVILKYLNSGEKPKDVVVCCGDNVFDLKSEEMLKFIVGTINNPQKQLGVVGVARTPEEVAKRFGVLSVGAKNPITGLYSLKGFVEKPELAAAQKLVTEDGNNVANTGMFVIKKDSMEKLLDIIRYERSVLGGKTSYIAKNEKEIFDFAAATKWAQFINGEQASDVKIVDIWEDVGEPVAYLNWMKSIKDGKYLQNFSSQRAEAIQKAVSALGRVDDNLLQFSASVPAGKIDSVIDGITVKA